MARLLLVVALGVPICGFAQEPAVGAEEADARARVRFTEGRLLYEQGRYEEAIVAFEEAYALSARPGLLYDIANAHERLGELEPAVEALTRFLPDAPEDQREVLGARVSALQQRIEERRAALPAPVMVPVLVPVPVPVPVAEPMVPPIPEQPPRRSPAPWVLATVGAVAAVGGGAVAGGTWVTSRDALDQRDRERWDALRPANNIGVGSAIAGGAVGIGGLVWGVARR